MSVDPTPVFDDWKAYIEDEFPFDVYVAEMPEDKALKYDSRGTLKPFIVLTFGGPIRAAGDRSIVTTRNDTQIVYLTISACGPTDEISRTLKGKLIDKLLGYRVFDGDEQLTGELTLFAGGSYSRASNNVRPTIYVEEQSFTTVTNLTIESS